MDVWRELEEIMQLAIDEAEFQASIVPAAPLLANLVYYTALESNMKNITLTLPQDDTLRYKVYVSKAIPRGDVTITANLNLLVSSRENAPEQINPRLMGALNDFIPGAWEFVGSNRSSFTPGFEKIAVEAIVKVSAEQNRNLQERARKAAREGLEFGEINVKRTLPQDQVNQIVKELWFEAVDRVEAHIDEFNKRSNRQWRIGDIVFGVPGSAQQQGQRLGKGAYREDVEDVLGNLVESGLAGAEKISLTADVTLKSGRPVL